MSETVALLSTLGMVALMWHADGLPVREKDAARTSLWCRYNVEWFAAGALLLLAISTLVWS